LKDKAKSCSFKDESHEIALQIIHRCRSTALKRRALEAEKDLTLDELIKYGKLEESVNLQIKELKKLNESEIDKAEVNALHNLKKGDDNPSCSGNYKGYGNHSYQHRSAGRSSKSNDDKNRRDVAVSGRHGEKQHKASSKKTCFKCGNEYPHEKVCPAKGKKCHKCNGYDHFMKCCKQGDNGRKHVRTVENDSESDSSYGNVWRVRLRNKIMSIKDWLMPMVTLWLCGYSLGFGVDTGAHVNIMDETSFRKLIFKPKLYKSKSRLYAYGQEKCIETIGCFQTRVKYKGQYRSIEFVVTKGGFGNLLSYKTCVDLGIMVKINSVESKRSDPEKDKIIKKYPLLFSKKIGLLKEHQVELHIDESVKPIQQKLRPVPFHMRPLVEAEILKMLEEDIIEPIKGPTPWVSPIVPVPKPDRPKEVRICTDAREMNKAISRTRHAFPTVEDLAVKLNGAKFISKFDLKSGYLQLLLAEKSRYITAFCTHMGIFQYKRLNFGINAASEIFQLTIEQVLSGLKGTMNIHDDIIVYGSNKAEHDERLEAVLKRLNESGLTLNESKCEFCKQSLTFFGMQFSDKGISIDMKKCDALLQARAPNTVGEVRSLLGLASYCSRFIPDYASVVEPLRKLTKKGAKWSWERVQDEALQKMKRVLCTEALSYFDPKLRTEITVDASPVGVAAVLCQYDPKHPSDKRVVMYASRSLTKVEQKYSQVEREALAFVWACEKFHIYVYAKEFDVITDNKAVELIFGNVRSKPKARIERWCLRLLPYKYVVKHKAGAYNIADYMSRNPIGPVDRGYEKFTESYVNLISNTSIPKAINRSELLKATKEDEDLIEVAKMLEGKQYTRKDSFEKVKMELSVSKDGLILRGNRVVIPKVFHKQVIKIAHGGHLGIVKTKQLLRSHVWFPSIDSQVEEIVKSCHKCQINTDLTKYELSCPTEMPDGPWLLVSVDFYGPLRCGTYLLVLVCEYSRYPLVRIVTSTSANKVIPVLNEIFSVFGIPGVLKSDNGPPFNSHDFKKFSLEQGFKHKKITPLWPRSNGMCERFMRNLGKVMRNSSSSQSDWEAELVEFLRNYRDTPHSSTGVAPYKLMFQSRAKTSKLPDFNTVVQSKGELHELAKHRDSQAKDKMKMYNDKKLKAQSNNFKVGDMVLVKWKRSNKSTSLFDPRPFKIIKINGTMITVERDGHILVRNSSFIKNYVQVDCEKARAQVLRDILFDKDKGNLNQESSEIILNQEEMDTQLAKGSRSSEGSESFATGEENDSNSAEEDDDLDDRERITDQEILEPVNEDVECGTNRRPKRLRRKPSWYGDREEYGSK
ncbi:unnamed protein product, partial [Brachionus calyciflorus]